MSGTIIDLTFPLLGSQPLQSDHGYHLYSAISHALPAAHESNGIALHPICGRQIGNRGMQLSESSSLTIRMADDRISDFLPLAGKQLKLAGCTLRVGIPQVRALTAATALRSRLVTIKNGMDPARFTAELLRKLAAMGVSEDAQVTLGKRRTLRIKDKEVVGYEVLIEALTAEESLAVQTNAVADPQLGFSRRHMGCGVFVPFNPRQERGHEGI